MAGPEELSASVERLRRRYLTGTGENYSLDTVEANCPSRRTLIHAGSVDSSLDDTVASLLINSPQSGTTYSERRHNKTDFSDSSKNFKNSSWLNELDYLHGPNRPEIQSEVNEDFTGSNEIPGVCTYSETDVTLPSHLALASSGYANDDNTIKQTVSFPENQVSNGQNLIPSHFSQIYHELSIIHQKLQQEKLTQKEYASKLEKKEFFLAEREALLWKHETALTKLRNVEGEIDTKFQIMVEQHEAEIRQLSEALKEKTKENKRLKSSFDTLKELNDTLKKQLSEVSEQNKKLEVQSRKVQARLENLQRKHEFLSIQRSKEAHHTAQERKPIKPEKVTSASRTYKVPLNSHIYELLTVLMEWISDQQLSKFVLEEEKEDIHKLAGTFASGKKYIQEKCIRFLPLVAELLQWMPFENPNLHLHMVKFIYWTIRQLDSGTQLVTLRRLGEDLFKGIVPKGSQHIPSEHATEPKLKLATFFKNSDLPLRLVSTLIIIKTVTQVDYLAQAFDSLCMDLKTDEGKELFLDYQAVPVILNHIRISNKGLLSTVFNCLLQMTTESRFQHRFLEACSNESFFRTCSVLLRNPKLDIQVLEKLSILLQKLSKIKSNKKMFELFTIHLMIQELQRTMDPDHAFLCINLNSILFNLGMTKSSVLANSLNTSQ